MAVELTTENFQDFVKSNDVVLVDFWAEWCAPCVMMAPVIDELEGEMDGVKFAKLNVDENPEIASIFGIMSIPTLMVFKGGEVADMVVGVVAKDTLKERIERHV
ncbi:MAG TPA: thioredoxin [Thermoplasmatales archaeon]|nr:thioredoxin [Thermoplasmatales archaeon]